MQPSCASHGQFFCIMISAFKFFELSLYHCKLQRTPIMEKLRPFLFGSPVLQEFSLLGSPHSWTCMYHSKGAISGFIGIANLQNKDNCDTSNPLPTSLVVTRASNKNPRYFIDPNSCIIINFHELRIQMLGYLHQERQKTWLLYSSTSSDTTPASSITHSSLLKQGPNIRASMLWTFSALKTQANDMNG